MAEQYIIENVEALWPRIDQTYVFDQKVRRSMPCGPRDTNAEFSIGFRMDNGTAKALFITMSNVWSANREKSWPEVLTNSLVKDDNGTYTGKSNIKGAYSGKLTTKPLQVDSQGTPLPDDFQLTTGSTVSVAVTFTPYYMSENNWGVSLRLKAVQVIKYVPMETRNPFDAVDGGFVLEDDNPFAGGAPTPAKSNNVLDDSLHEGFDEEEAPVKRTATKAAPAPDSDAGDLGAIIDNWDD